MRNVKTLDATDIEAAVRTWLRVEHGELMVLGTFGIRVRGDSVEIEVETQRNTTPESNPQR